MLCSMANSGCLLLSNSGSMLPHSAPCPPAFLYLQQPVVIPFHSRGEPGHKDPAGGSPSSSEVLGDSQSQKASPPHPASRDTVHAAAVQARPRTSAQSDPGPEDKAGL
ncbi:hypothetical protein MJG53_015574 [Ovis ammon polii x Ovis aries]|uniref:Uncharacterized protein n=1 Tax=Ovis ammon polii x Ovis aries TaxID=2918886 RepID=A0ACB9UFL2_9CETA|nr:hypothetical protein MJG53_015574 [Ovis ammon polii x Ovis aries]